MSSMPSPKRSEFSEDVWPAKSPSLRADVRRLTEEVEGKRSATTSTETIAMSPTEPSSDAKIRLAVLKRKQPSLRRRAARSLSIFCMGVATTLAWQSYGNVAREMIASSYPQLGWLAPQSALAETAPEMISPKPPVSTSDSLELKSTLVNLAALRQSVDQLAASQQQMASEIAKLKAVEQDVFDKISSAPPPRPAAAPARKPAPVPPPPQSSETSPGR